jgi:glycogen synthase
MADLRARRCLLLSYVFAPSVGGIETVSRTLAESLVARGFEVRVVTCSQAIAAIDTGATPYSVIRNPSAFELCRLLRWCDVVLQSNFSVRLAWPLALLSFPRRWIIVHHTPLTRPSGRITVRDRLKRWMTRRADCYAVSHYLASIVPQPCGVLFNPYDETAFRLLDNVSRTRTLIFVGRLVPAKGLDVLLQALALLRAQTIVPQLTVVGDGPERAGLEQMSRSLGIDDQVGFVGPRFGSELVRLLNEHLILVVPSRASPPECLPMVCLEGIACGCVVIGARQGGLPEAIGPCGETFESESAADLAQRIRDLLSSAERRAQRAAQREMFLRNFARSAVLEHYQMALENAAPIKRAAGARAEGYSY